MLRVVPLISLCLACAACDAIDTPAARAARKYEASLASRDPDKLRNIYWCAGNVVRGTGSFNNYAAIFGDAMRIDAYHADGSETYVVEQWGALPGPDRVVRRIHMRFRNNALFERRVEIVDPEWRDDC
jgi:hypothetical protein